MKKLKKIELSRVDFNPNSELSSKEMRDIEGGAGCICYNRRFNVNGECVCYHNPFGLCNTVNGCYAVSPQ